MKPLDDKILALFWHDEDAREIRLREVIADRLANNPAPAMPDHVVATYFFAFRNQTLTDAVAEISYHATSGIRKPPAGSLLEECTATAAGVDAFDSTGRMGLLRIAYPLKMLLQPDGHLTSVDLLHTTAGAIIFDVYENQDAKLIDLAIPERVVRTFPGPAYGPKEMRRMNGFSPGEPSFGTILKPTAGITPDVVGKLVEEAAACTLFLFVKEDENLYPNLEYSPVRERMKQAAVGIERSKGRRGQRGIIFAPHVTGAPNEIMESVHAAVEAGATGVMFSESFAGGMVRMVREATKSLPRPPAIYGHNAGIGVRTRAIWREVIDYLARLDGIDFRQTAPVKPGQPFLKPFGTEWEGSERVLAMPIDGVKPTMIARAGGLDQGNLILNLMDAEARGLGDDVLYLAGSAINSIKGKDGKADPSLGAQAMQEALDVHRSGAMRDVPAADHVRVLSDLAASKKLTALREALKQRYPG